MHYVFTQILRYFHAVLDCASMKADILHFQTCLDRLISLEQVSGTKVSESISDSIADLRQLSQGCNFSEIEIMLHDWLVTDLQDEELQIRLFSRKNLTFELALALSAEVTAQHTQDIHASDKHII
ncbi:hypothetical protein T01_12672 [Trichinella spiralis]|uniref:Uncharacterized protein n=1 Tax=Trichinella spiralis TaxID=6334 RepID=A0A0V1BRC1_TRISP|nr:hypothetical protein T01_12672 [Trichinella spiralis]